MDINEIEKVKNEALGKISNAKTLEDVVNIKNEYLSKKSYLNSLMGELKSLSPEEKAKAGQIINATKVELNQKFDEKSESIKTEALNKKLAEEKIDISLPGDNYNLGGINPFYIIRDEMIDIFTAMGYKVEHGPEVELDKYNFELLNIPHDHPARDMQDTFYINDSTLLRTHTSPVQARTMEKMNGKPIKMICPGKVFRRDDDDMTHSHQFAQVEGLCIDKDINLGNLKSTLEFFAKKMFGEKREIRFRSSYFPFTEPSVEVDISCAECGGKGCSMCKGTGWIEILGAGMVHPNVLKMNGYDPEVYSGFAFGIGIDRVAMLRYGIDDVRRIYQNDIRFINQFKKKVED